MNIVLVEPEIPQNTGNIARTCAATNTALHLVHPMGFSIDEKQVRRAGLDYWPMVTIIEYENLQDFLQKNKGASLYFASTKAQMDYTQPSYKKDDFLVFGKETKGLPEDLLQNHMDRCIRIPMLKSARSLNLGNSAAIILYEALRQIGFPGLCDSSDHFPLTKP